MAAKSKRRSSRSSRRAPRRRHGDVRRTMDAGEIDARATESLQRAKLRARNEGDLTSAILSAAYYAKKLGQTMHVYQGNSFMHAVWRVSFKPGEYLNSINNTGPRMLSVTPDLTVSWHDLR
jgi:hypothetical protein